MHTKTKEVKNSKKQISLCDICTMQYSCKKMFLPFRGQFGLSVAPKKIHVKSMKAQTVIFFYDSDLKNIGIFKNFKKLK